ncbi:hypothetical protein NOR38_004600 [Salmonella enterica]|nr:hypothetical protein [Salmonella enterica]
MSYTEPKMPRRDCLFDDVLNLSVAGADDLIAALEREPVVQEKLLRAAQAYKDLLKGGGAVISPPLATFPRSSVDEIADQFQNSNQRVCKRSYCPQNDD